MCLCVNWVQMNIRLTISKRVTHWLYGYWIKSLSKVEVSSVLKPCGAVVGYQHFRGPFYLPSPWRWNTGIQQHDMASQPRRPGLETSPPLKPRNSHKILVYMTVSTCYIHEVYKINTPWGRHVRLFRTLLLTGSSNRIFSYRNCSL